MGHPPYSPDLAPCDFYLFPKAKNIMWGEHFVDVELQYVALDLYD
jgi:hypothetical protein